MKADLAMPPAWKPLSCNPTFDAATTPQSPSAGRAATTPLEESTIRKAVTKPAECASASPASRWLQQ